MTIPNLFDAYYEFIFLKYDGAALWAFSYMETVDLNNGITGMVPRDKMSKGAQAP